jgi:hypothetical protein
LGVGQDLLQGEADFVDGSERVDLSTAGDIYKDGQHDDDGQAYKQYKKVFGHAAFS